MKTEEKRCFVCGGTQQYLYAYHNRNQYVHAECKPMDYRLESGTVQAMARCDNPFWCYHFGHAQYDRDKPILTDSIRAQAQPIIDALNAGTMTREEAEKEFDKIWL